MTTFLSPAAFRDAVAIHDALPAHVRKPVSDVQSFTSKQCALLARAATHDAKRARREVDDATARLDAALRARFADRQHLLQVQAQLQGVQQQGAQVQGMQRELARVKGDRMYDESVARMEMANLAERAKRAKDLLDAMEGRLRTAKEDAVDEFRDMLDEAEEKIARYREERVKFAAREKELLLRLDAAQAALTRAPKAEELHDALNEADLLRAALNAAHAETDAAREARTRATAAAAAAQAPVPFTPIARTARKCVSPRHKPAAVRNFVYEKLCWAMGRGTGGVPGAAACVWQGRAKDFNAGVSPALKSAADLCRENGEQDMVAAFPVDYAGFLKYLPEFDVLNFPASDDSYAMAMFKAYWTGVRERAQELVARSTAELASLHESAPVTALSGAEETDVAARAVHVDTGEKSALVCVESGVSIGVESRSLLDAVTKLVVLAESAPRDAALLVPASLVQEITAEFKARFDVVDAAKWNPTIRDHAQPHVQQHRLQRATAAATHTEKLKHERVLCMARAVRDGASALMYALD